MDRENRYVAKATENPVSWWVAWELRNRVSYLNLDIGAKATENPVS